MKENAILLTAGFLTGHNAKTAHGLIRKTARYNIVGVIDNIAAGQDAGFLVDGIRRDIPVYPAMAAFMRSGIQARYAVVGVAFAGGKLPPLIMEAIREALAAGISIVSGAHEFLSDMPEIVTLARQHDAELLDIRKPRPKDQLKFWSGDIMQVKVPVIGVLGTDCALGKRTTAVMVTDAMKAMGVKAEMIYTGQTGWLQGHKYGFVLDSTYNDFISGELEHAILTCYKEEAPAVMFVEGQSALCNPSGPCGGEFLLSAQCKGVILQHAPARIYYKGQDNTGIRISLSRELDLIRIYGSQVLAITLNTAGLNLENALSYKMQFEQEYGIPVVLPLEEGVGRLTELVGAYVANFNKV